MLMRLPTSSGCARKYPQNPFLIVSARRNPPQESSCSVRLPESGSIRPPASPPPPHTDTPPDCHTTVMMCASASCSAHRLRACPPRPPRAPDTAHPAIFHFPHRLKQFKRHRPRNRHAFRRRLHIIIPEHPSNPNGESLSCPFHPAGHAAHEIAPPQPSISSVYARPAHSAVTSMSMKTCLPALGCTFMATSTVVPSNTRSLTDSVSKSPS